MTDGCNDPRRQRSDNHFRRAINDQYGRWVLGLFEGRIAHPGRAPDRRQRRLCGS
jgi:hypothetical protein